MKALNRMLVAMDLSEIDQQLLSYLKLLAQGRSDVKAYLLHVAPTLEVPVAVLDTHSVSGTQMPLDERIRRVMQDTVHLSGEADDITYEFDVIEGKVTPQLLHWQKVKNIDLTILGRKKIDAASGVEPRRLLRRSESAVIFVPEHIEAKITRILVPVDFSAYSQLALQQAVDFVRYRAPNASVQCLHVYDVPSELHFELLRTREQFAEIIRENVKEVYQDFIHKIDLGGVKVEPHFVENTHFNPAKHIYKFAQEAGTDLIVMGAQGRSDFSAFLLGSVTEKLVTYNDQIATMVIR
jgi:nucleotide-binding universal stress UspA family protein